MNEFEARKRALAAESELLRHMLKFEVRNLRLAAAHTRGKYTRLPVPGPWLMLLTPIAGWWMRRQRRRRASLPRLATVAFVGLQLYNKLTPIVRTLLFRWSKLKRSHTFSPRLRFSAPRIHSF